MFIDGCFWHSCPDHGVAPKANAAWWQAKFAANRRRDNDTDRHLREIGWVPLRFWEHEDPEAVVDEIQRAVEQRRNGHL